MTTFILRCLPLVLAAAFTALLLSLGYTASSAGHPLISQMTERGLVLAGSLGRL